MESVSICDRDLGTRFRKGIEGKEDWLRVNPRLELTGGDQLQTVSLRQGRFVVQIEKLAIEKVRKGHAEAVLPQQMSKHLICYIEPLTARQAFRITKEYFTCAFKQCWLHSQMPNLKPARLIVLETPEHTHLRPLRHVSTWKPLSRDHVRV